MTDNSARRVVYGEIVPATPRSVTLAPEVSHLPQGLLGIGFFARTRYASERKQFEAYSRLVNAKNHLLAALIEQQRLLVGYAIADERVRQLDNFREIARLQVRHELSGIRRVGELNELQLDIEKERLLLEHDRVRKARSDFNAPPAPPANEPGKKPSLADGFEKVGKEIENIEQAHQRFSADVIERAGGEQNLSDDQRRRLRQFELLRDKLLNEAMEALF